MSWSFLMAGGGTGGHVVPALAVARELRRRGHQPFFVGTRTGVEARLVPREEFPLEWIEIGGLKGLGLSRRLRTLWQLRASVVASRRILRQRKPAALFSMGGYVAAPPMLAAISRRLPMVLMEPNAVAGLTSRWLGRFAAKALVSFEETMRSFPAGRSEVTGLPIREEFFTLPAKPPAEEFSVLVTGGSQGSRTLNQAARASWPALAGQPVRMTLQCGRPMEAELTEAFARSGMRGEVRAFLEDMPAAFAQADLVIARAGAGSLSELCASGRPSVLVPYPFAADDHQRRNAEAMERKSAARMVLDGDFTGERLQQEIAWARANHADLQAMGDAARRLAKRGAAERAADYLEELAAGGKT
ncbi:MAG: undecaprenyldiphospho-muramoylpentapeptide beta-N-acetylglucosaminyltransferase [Bryobacteraceae bacterium]|nr:undecaprenyldiphospho-muramoylpentapeptide beta-N-acetylglucosaminyltransferase [Bryobacteraceae bacterium]